MVATRSRARLTELQDASRGAHASKVSLRDSSWTLSMTAQRNACCSPGAAFTWHASSCDTIHLQLVYRHTGRAQVGHWWEPKASEATGARPLGGSSAAGSAEEAALLKLAARQRMNTDARRAVFCVLMSADDYVRTPALRVLKLCGHQTTLAACA